MQHDRFPARDRCGVAPEGGSATRSAVVRTAIAVALGACLLIESALESTFGFAFVSPVAEARRHSNPDASLAVVRVAELPPEGREVLARIRAGGPFASRRDGIPFGNRERLLPAQPRGYYAEFTVPTPGADNRGARRIVAGRGAGGDVRTSNEYYYTNDHYQSFRRIVQ